MEIKNLQENIVYGTLGTILENQYPEIAENESIMHDVAAFVLNKLPPFYTTGERGYTRFVGGVLYKPDQKDIIKIIVLINHAIEVVLTRRRNIDTIEDSNKKNSIRHSIRNSIRNAFKNTITHTIKNAIKNALKGMTKDTFEDDEFNLGNFQYIRFPVIVGTVRDGATKKPVKDVTVSLFYKDNEIVPMGSARWDNPAITQRGNLAYFSLWPQIVVNSDQPEERRHSVHKIDYDFYLKASHKSYQNYNSTITITADYRYFWQEFDFDNFHDIGEVLLQKN